MKLFGHDGFLIEREKLSGVINNWLHNPHLLPKLVFIHHMSGSLLTGINGFSN